MTTVGDVIERHRAEILHLWEEGAGRPASTDGLRAAPELASVMPAYLDSLGRSAGEEQALISASQEQLIERHLSTRLRDGFELNEIVTEFAILGRCVSRIVDQEPADDRPPAAEVERLFSELHAAVLAATRMFTQHMYAESVRLQTALTEEKRTSALEGELRERYVSVLMHDLTGPLEAAKANAHRLREPWTLEDPQDVAAKVVRDLERMEWMVGELLDVHSIRAGQKLRLRLEDCDLGAIARDAVEELRASHGNRFVLRSDRRTRGMWSPDHLRRAIWNLAVNGIEHGAAGRPVTVSVVGGPGGAEVNVHNEGTEIPAQEQAELFHPFSLPGSAIHGPRCGWGLGLTFVWGCVEAHGGKVMVDSLAGQGTTFRLLLPYDARPYTA